MQSLELDCRCPECSGSLIDAGDEFACSGCGLVKAKEPLDPPREAVEPGVAKRSFLGSYMGTLWITKKERASRGLSGSNSKYEYLKMLSDYSGRQEGVAEACDRLILRVGEKLVLPAVVMEQASSMARSVLSSDPTKRRVTAAVLSAYSLINACKVEGVTSASVSEIIEAHAALGRKVSSSSIIQLSLESPFKSAPRGPEDYIVRVLARLSRNGKVCQELKRKGIAQTPYFNSLRETAAELLLGVKKAEMTGKRPCALAASAVYSAELVLASRESRGRLLTQRDLAQCGDAAEYTIRAQVAEIFMPVVKREPAQVKRTQ